MQLNRDSGHGPWGPIVLKPSVLTLAGVRCRAPRHARLGARNPRYTARRALHFARHRLLVRLRRSPAAASAACRRDPRPPAAAIHARRAASVRCCRRSEAEREHQGRRRRRRPASGAYYQRRTRLTQAFVSRVEDGGYQLFRTAGRPGVGCPRAGTRSPSDASAGQRASGERRDGRCR